MDNDSWFLGGACMGRNLTCVYAVREGEIIK